MQEFALSAFEAPAALCLALDEKGQAAYASA